LAGCGGGCDGRAIAAKQVASSGLRSWGVVASRVGGYKVGNHHPHTAMSTLDPALTRFLQFLARHPQVRQRLAAPPDRTVVYSGKVQDGDALTDAWQLLARRKAQDPHTNDYVTLEERLRQFHAVEFGESLFDHARRVARSLNLMGRNTEAVILWRALSGIYVQGARGRVRALVVPGPQIAGSVFNLTEVKVLLQPDVLRQIAIDPELLRNFRLQVQAGTQPTPIVVF
jgi:hypothetical protein